MTRRGAPVAAAARGRSDRRAGDDGTFRGRFVTREGGSEGEALRVPARVEGGGGGAGAPPPPPPPLHTKNLPV